jgi:arginyl-tRNA synthetase
MKKEISELLKKAINSLQQEQELPNFEIPKISVEHPEKEIHGDFSSNLAMEIGKIIKKNPLEIAEIIIQSLNQSLFDKVEVAKPGFINFFLSKTFIQEQIGKVLKQNKEFGNIDIGKKKKVQVEFISANPTGPLTLGNGRGGFCGDVLANVLQRAGYDAEKEYYINDIGEQIRKLGHSVIGDDQAVYKGDYIKELRKKIKGENIEKVGQEAADFVLEEKIKPTVKKMGIDFDIWFSEKSLHTKEIENVLKWLKDNDLIYEKDKAVWFKSEKFGDDKDRVLIKADGEKTYFLSDIAYLKNKFERGFEHIICIWGADHHGYIERMKSAVQALGYKKEQLDVIIMQLVRLVVKGEKVRMSKRKGIYITLDELIDEVGIDSTRFFFLQRRAGSHLNFDMSLAKDKSEKNPVYYIQYAYARICSILAKSQSVSQQTNFQLLNNPSELRLIKQLIKLPEIIEDTAKDYQIQRMSLYAYETASCFHQFYKNCRVLTENKELSNARLSLILATKIVLKNTLDTMGISAPEKM